MTKIFIMGFATAILLSCANEKNETNQSAQTADSTNAMKISLPDRKAFQDTIDGKLTDLYILKNSNGMTAAITTYGGRLVGLWVPDKNGKFTDVVVGFGSVQNYIKSTEAYFGATIGRFGNRIAKVWYRIPAIIKKNKKRFDTMSIGNI
jgi:aldose 1-epimerase